MERIWRGTDLGATLARAALAPLEGVYAGLIAVRGAFYDSGVLRSHPTALPTLSVGNLSVGGTGKTPVSSWIAAELRGRGARPAVVLRGYGDDEPMVHTTLNPDIPVVVSADRVWGVERARVIGADVAVLDDAFQHRRARRDADVVLLSTDQWDDPRRLLPAGPWREPLRALRRASLVIATRKASSLELAHRVIDAVARIAPTVASAIVHLAPMQLRAATGPGVAPLSVLQGARVLAVAAIGDPRAFLRQLEGVAAAVRPAVFPDHHIFQSVDAVRLALDAHHCDFVVCTLKDAVKLGALWPREAPPLWYVSQRPLVEHGGAAVASLLDDLLQRRPARVHQPPRPGAFDSTHGH